MTIYQRKTVTVEAIQWTCDNFAEVAVFTNNNVAISADMTCVVVNGETACENDWIVKLVAHNDANNIRYSIMSDTLFQSTFEVPGN